MIAQGRRKTSRVPRSLRIQPSSMDNENIILCSPNEAVFFHELAHAAHRRTNMKLTGGQHWDQEVVAELTAAVLCRAIGKEPENLGASYRYIANYAKEADRSPLGACIAVVKEVEQVLNLITLACYEIERAKAA